MADLVSIPNLPGLPPLLRIPGVTISLPTLLTADAPGITSTFPNTWGVFSSAGQKVVTFDTFLSIDYRQGWVIADFPLEQGAFQSYDKVQTPFDVRVKFASGGNLNNRERLLQSIAAIAGDLNFYTVVTPEAVYNSVNIQHYDYRRTNTNGNGLITVELWLLEVRSSSNNQQQGNSGQNPNTTAEPQLTNTGVTNPLVFSNGAPPIANAIDPSGVTPFNGGTVEAIAPGTGSSFSFGPGVSF